MEQAIRSALAKGNAADPAYRQRIYRSAQNALERALREEKVVEAAAMRQRREQLTGTIASVEAEHSVAPAEAAGSSRSATGNPSAPPTEPPIAALSPSAPEVAAPAVDAPVAAGAPDRSSARKPAERKPKRKFWRRGRPAGTQRRDPEVQDPATPRPTEPSRGEPAAVPSPETEGRGPATRRSHIETRAEARPARRKRRPFRTALIFLAALVVLAIGVGFLLQSLGGSAILAELGSTQTAVVGEDAETEGGLAPSLGGTVDARRQIVLFDALSGDATARAEGGATASLQRSSRQDVLRVEGPAGSSLVIPISVDELRQLSGQETTIAIRAQSNEDVDMVVTCDFAGLGDCGRRRYSITNNAGDYLFGQDFERRVPEGEGSVTLTIPRTGSIDLYAVSALVGD